MLMKQMAHAAELMARRSPLAPLLKTLLQRPSLFSPALRIGRASGWDQAAQWLVSREGRSTRENPLLINLLKHDSNRDIETEFLLTAVRKHFLLSGEELLAEPSLQSFVCALIQQCINNEYVWFVSKEEQQKIAKLTGPTGKWNMAGNATWQTLAVLAMYRRLNELLGLGVEDSDQMRMRACEGLPDGLRTLVESYIATYEEEKTIKESIESFGTIKDSVSQLVAGMYEVSPYPRWFEQHMKVSRSGSRRELLRQFFVDEELAFLRRPFDVLIPGCGTGSSAIQIAIGFGEGAQVLAIDLSRASLAYAARKARQFGVKNIKFLQMDILDLPKLGQQFDVVECTGVLVTMRDPLEGGKAIVDTVRPGGVVHISLYSELARREIVRLRKEYEHRIASISPDEIRAYRYRWMREHPDRVDALPDRGDFFDLNRCKDLLFHPSEHRHTIPELGRFLDALHLEFRGFQEPALIPNQYWTPFPPNRDQRNLDAWWAFEQKNPDAFQLLYETWCRKAPT
jgi:SAM-dependent methyltransferase